MAIRKSSKGMAGMGGRGKDKPKSRQDKATARKRSPRAAGLKGLEARATVPGKPSTKSKTKANQGKNQRSWHAEKREHARKSSRAPARV